MKKIVAFAGFSLLAVGAFAQTNLQVFYDFGENRKYVTSTLEMFKADDFGNTFFFVDYDHNWKNADDKIISPSLTYMEIARCFNFWGESALAPLSLQIEYNGGFGAAGYTVGFPIEKAWLFGVDYFMHNDDFSNTFNFKLLYKNINYNGALDLNLDKRASKIPLQFTFVWGMQNIFGVEGLRFSGFADFWGESHILLTDAKGDALTTPEDSDFVFLSEPQLWYNVGQHFDVPNLNVGTEVELSYDFGTTKGFAVRPCLGFKWVF